MLGVVNVRTAGSGVRVAVLQVLALKAGTIGCLGCAWWSV